MILGHRKVPLSAFRFEFGTTNSGRQRKIPALESASSPPPRSRQPFRRAHRVRYRRQSRIQNSTRVSRAHAATGSILFRELKHSEQSDHARSRSMESIRYWEWTGSRSRSAENSTARDNNFHKETIGS